jgi:hypothetical protein
LNRFFRFTIVKSYQLVLAPPPPELPPPQLLDEESLDDVPLKFSVEFELDVDDSEWGVWGRAMK